MTNQENKVLRHLDKEYWSRRWEEDQTQWHRLEVSPMLEKYIRLLDEGKADLKFFVPLCGKTFDMKWLFDQGHRVVGVDGCQVGPENFFREHSMEYTVDTKNGIPVFTEKSGRIVLYCCNILDFDRTGEGSFDAVWDRASFGAINSEERTRYVDLLTNLKKRNAPHLLELYEYDDPIFNETPFNLPMSKTSEYWGELYDVKFLESYDVPETAHVLHLDWCKINLFLLTFK